MAPRDGSTRECSRSRWRMRSRDLTSAAGRVLPSPVRADPNPEAPIRPLLLGPVLLFDGVCHLCHATVRWVAAHDRHASFRFASLESASAPRRNQPGGVKMPSEAGERVVECGRAWAL